MIRSRVRFVVALFAVGCSCGAPAHPTVSPPPADLVMVNGRVRSGHEWSDAIAIRDGRIEAIGEDAKKVASTRRIDLGGRIVIAGLHDAHVHEPSLFDAYEVPEGGEFAGSTIQQLEKAVHEVPEGTWLHATLETSTLDEVAETYNPKPIGDSKGHIFRAPPVAPLDRTELDRVAPKHPVWLDNSTGHVVVLNTAAEKLLALGPLPPGSFTGPDGWYYEYGRYAAMRKRGANATDAQVTAAIDAFEGEAVAFGITSVTTFPLDIDAERLTKVLIATPRKMFWNVVRVPIGGVLPSEHARAWRGPGESRVILAAAAKYFIDGMEVERGAALRDRYEGSFKDDPLAAGRLDWSPEEIRTMLESSRSSGEVLHLHVVGDRALDVVFTQMETLGGYWPRVVIEHGYMLQDVARAEKLGITIVVNPFHSEMVALNRARLGDRVKYWMPMKSLRAAHVPVQLGSDGPLDPFRNIQLAEQNPTNPAEAITRDEALDLYTQWENPPPATATLWPGAEADLAVLSGEVDDPNTRSLLTMVAGEVVYGNVDQISQASGPTSARTE
jgi:predicted amidohydrolase YtcJ